ncbi:MAG: peptidylprolyl isomerase [Christensenellales bacterium]|jgi:peptidyl-prolyl cis-trans isomerase B (cyclophilin B)
MNKNPIVTFTMSNGDMFKAELFPEKAPITVNSFLSLIKKGFYKDVIFHRVVKDFVIQGGDPTGTGMGGPGYCIRGEFQQNGVDNDVPHTLGTLSMARAQAMNSGGSQFFIVTGNARFLDGQYAAFGRVIEGMEAVERIHRCDTDNRDRPLTEQRIASVIVDTFGVEYPEPEKLPER